MENSDWGKQRINREGEIKIHKNPRENSAQHLFLSSFCLQDVVVEQLLTWMSFKEALDDLKLGISGKVFTNLEMSCKFFYSPIAFF